jgi:hypothetical protein
MEAETIYGAESDDHSRHGTWETDTVQHFTDYGTRLSACLSTYIPSRRLFPSEVTGSRARTELYDKSFLEELPNADTPRHIYSRTVVSIPTICPG